MPSLLREPASAQVLSAAAALLPAPLYLPLGKEGLLLSLVPMKDKNVSLLLQEISFFLPASELCLVQMKKIIQL